MLTPELKQIDECYSLYLEKIEEPRDNSLRLVIEEARPGAEETIELPGIKLEKARRIEPDETCRLFEVVWPEYVAYSVTNEIFAQDTPSDVVSEGTRRVRFYSRSKFVEFVFPGKSEVGELFHIELICENHVVNVISEELPDIRVLRSPQVH